MTLADDLNMKPLFCLYYYNTYTVFCFSDSYDVLVTAASFSPGHLNEDCYEDLISITKIGKMCTNKACVHHFSM